MTVSNGNETLMPKKILLPSLSKFCFELFLYNTLDSKCQYTPDACLTT